MLDEQSTERERLQVETAIRRERLTAAAERLSASRRAAAARLAAQVNPELPALGLPAGAFGVELTQGSLGPGGHDRVLFTFAPNPGEPARPLARIASGGEASRLSLALKVALAAADQTPVLVFDEIDAGVGGMHGAALGERLRRLADHHQVLCVTHLPQVAAYADAHLHVSKRVLEGRTFTTVRRLEGDDRAAEMASMLAGTQAGPEAQAAARELLRGAQAATGGAPAPADAR